MRPIRIFAYDPGWPLTFESLRSKLWPAVEDLAIRIEHVGSTSVPGLSAKPVIDIDIVVAKPDVECAIKRLAPLGYEHLGDLGIVQREAFRSPAGAPDHHLYVCPSTSPALANHLAFRDCLRRSSTVRREYAELKQRLAREYGSDREGYSRAKTEFVLRTLRSLGLEEHVLAEIERGNISRRTRSFRPGS